MITIENTIDFIKKAHYGVVDKAGEEYWKHPFAVYTLLDDDATDAEKHASLLHDIIEDTSYTYKNLSDMGYSEEVIDILKLITKEIDDFRSYETWIKSIIDSGNTSAIKIKKADIKHNMQMERLDKLDKNTRNRLIYKYKLGWNVIMNYERNI